MNQEISLCCLTTNEDCQGQEDMNDIKIEDAFVFDAN
jgi:hypothetical protein